MKLRTLSDLQDALDREMGWRLQEIAAMKTQVKGSIDTTKKGLARAGLALLYAHWEGFTKRAAENYIRYVASLRLRNEELSDSFLGLAAKSNLSQLEETNQARLYIESVRFFRNKLSIKSTISTKYNVNTQSNLRSGRFANILTSIGIDPYPYEPKYNFIDSSLVDRRNAIAHGEYLEFAPDDFGSIADEVIALLRAVKTDIENAASQKKFLHSGQSTRGRSA